MKKLIAISVLLVCMAAAVFAQDDKSKWKVGFMARYVTDMLYATSASGKSEESGTGITTNTKKYGEFNKGSIDFFGGHDNLPHQDNRLMLSISNSGENYEVYADMKIDGWAANNWDGSVMSLINAGSADWWLKGTAGIFNAQVGTAGYGGWVSPIATWNDWLGWNQLCRFGVWRGNDYNDDFYASNEFRTWNQWGTVAAFGVTLADSYRLSLGYKLDNPKTITTSTGSLDPWANKSAINGSFMISGKPLDLLSFDLFYAVTGKDDYTFARPGPAAPGATVLTPPTASWSNIIGAYIGLNIVENLGLSLGYTANFNAFEAGSYYDTADTDANPVKTKPVTYTAPIYSGIDIRVSFSGIDKIGLTFNNNLSFAGVKGKKYDAGYNKELTLGLDESVTFTDLPGEGYSQDWFHWNAELQATFAIVENLGLTLHLGNQLGVTTDGFSKDGKTTTDKRTNNEFRVSLIGDYGIGAVNIGTGLFFSVASTVHNLEGSGNGDNYNFDGSSNVTTFGIPIFFKVAF